MADGKVKLEVEVTGKNAKIVQREVEGVTDAVNENTAAQRRNEKATRQASGAVGEATKVHKHYDRGLKGASGSSSSVSKNFSKMRDVMGGSSGLVGAYATLAANLFAASAAFTALQKAAQLEQISSGLTYLGKATGVAMGSLSSNLQKATGYGISLGESMKSVAMVTTAGFDPSYIERLGKVARNTSTALGRDLSDSLDRLVRGAVKLEPELLDELGIMVRIDDATSKYAASLGKSAASLTTFEKQQAFMNTVLEEGEKKFGGIGDSVEINPYDKLSASLQELAKTFLNLVNVALKPFVSFLADNKEILAGFIAVLSKSVITQAFEAFTDFSKVQAVVAGQQKNIAVAADAAAKRSVEAQKAKLKLFDSSFGKWGKEQNLLLENAKSAKDYEALLQRARKTLALRQSEAVQNRTLDKAAATERNNFLLQEIASYEKLILLEKRRAMGLAAGAAGRAAPKRETAFSRLRESIAPTAPAVPAKAATASSKLANRTAKSLSSLDMDSSFANYRQQLKYAAASGEQYRKSMKGVEQASLTSFARIIPGAGQATVAIRSLGGVAKIAVKGFFAMIPVIGEFVMIAWTVWEVVKAISNAFKSTETKAFEDALESAKTKLDEVSTNSKEVNKALAGQSTIIRSYSQLVEAQSNNLKELNSTFSDLAKKADAAGDGYSDIVEQANNAIKDNEILTESFKKQSGGLKTLEEWKSKNNKTDEETAKFALELIKRDNVIWHSKLNVIKSLKEATKATTEYLNSLKQTSPLLNYVDTVLNVGKAFDSSVMSFKEGSQEIKDYLLTISNLSMEQAKLLGLSAQQFNDLRQLASEYENVGKAVESYKELASRPVNTMSARAPINKLIEDFNKTIGAEAEIKEVPGSWSNGSTLAKAALDTQRAINNELDDQSKKLEDIKKRTQEILKVAGPIIQKRMEEAKDIKLSLTYQQQIIPILEKINGLDQERIKSRQEELNLIAEIKTLENEIKNLKSGGSGIQSAQQAYDIEKQLYAERRSLIEEETKSKVEQLNLQKQNQVIELSIQRINLRNTLASGNLNDDEFKLIKENYGIISKRLGLIDDSNAELTKREEIIAAETALNNVKNLLVEAQLELLTKDNKLEAKTKANAAQALERLKTAREKQAEAEATAAGIRNELQLREGQLLSRSSIQTIEEIYATKIRAAQTEKQKELLALEKNILILGNAVDKEKYQNTVDAAQIEMEVFKARADIEQKIIDAKKSILDNESKIQEQALMLQNFKNPAIAEYKLTIEQQYALEAESATRRIQLIEQEARIKEDTIKKEEALLIAQTNLQRAEMAMRMVDVNARAGRKVFSDEQATSLLATFDEVIRLIPDSTSAQIEEVRSGAIVAAGEITGSLAKTAEEIYGWSKNNVVTWQGISQAFGERLKEDLRSSIPLVKQMANAFADSVNAAVDGFVDAIVEGKNIFKAVGDAFRNTLRDSFAEMAKNKLKEGIASIFEAFNLGDMFKTTEQKSAEASKVAAEATAKNTADVKTATQNADKALNDSKITWESIKTATETTMPTSINELKNSIDTSVVTGLTTINDTLINVVNTTLTTISNTMSSLLNKPCCEAQQPVTSDLADMVGAALRSAPSTVTIPMATGGMISGPGGPKDDRIPAMLSNGEFVVNAKATQENLKLLQAINSGNLPGFANGGGVSLYHTARNAKQLKKDISGATLSALTAEAVGLISPEAESLVEGLGLREVLKDPMYKKSLTEYIDRYLVNSLESKEIGRLMAGTFALGGKDLAVMLGRLTSNLVGPLMWLWDSYEFGNWVGNWLNENTAIQAKLANTIDQMTGLAPVDPKNPAMHAMGRATGGMISGPGGPKDDKIPAMLSNGEFVVNAASTKKYLSLLEAINSGNIPRFNKGGLVTSFEDKTVAGQYESNPSSGGGELGEKYVKSSRFFYDEQIKASENIGDYVNKADESINVWGKLQTFATDNVGKVIAAGFTGMATAIASGASPKKAFLGSVLGSLGGVIGGAIGSMAGPAGAAFGSQIGGALGGGIAQREFAMGGVMTSSGPLPLEKYAKGGIAKSPQLALYGEGSRPEAYVPLPDGRSIPVSMSGGGNVNNVSVNVSVTGGQAQTQTSSAGGKDQSEEQARMLGVAISNAVKQEMLNQQRPGGLLYKGRR